MTEAEEAECYRWLRDRNPRVHYTTDWDADGPRDVIQIEVYVDGEPLFTPDGRFDFAMEMDRAIQAELKREKGNG